jgi:acetolactate synthase-1/2/3 large subunit
MNKLTGSDALISSLANEGVEVIFGVPGEHLMGVLDSVYKQQGIRWITARQEQTAAYMAFGYARTTGKVGVAIVVPGPGALNATAALGTAYATSTPVLLISGQIGTDDLDKGSGALHEVVDQIEVFRSITKWRHCTRQVKEIPWAVRQAMLEAESGRQRPVAIEVPRDLLPAEDKVDIGKTPEAAPLVKPDKDQIDQAASLLASAKKPVIWAGGGVLCSDATEALTLVAEKLNAPVITTAEGKGAIRGDHPLFLGASYCGYGPDSTLPQADIILAVGSRLFSAAMDPISPSLSQKLIHIDVDSTEIGRNHAARLGIVGDARVTLELLLEALPAKNKSTWKMEELDKIRDDVRAQLEGVAPLQLSLIRTIREELKADDIYIPGVTNVSHWGELSYPVLQPRTYLNSGYFATLGYAFPTALGAKVGNPDKHVVVTTGDGGFMYCLTDLATAVQEKINIVVIVFVDNAFGASLHDQHLRFGSRVIGTQLQNPDFADIARGFGAEGIKLTKPDELGNALRTALDLDRDVPTVIEVPLPTLLAPFH